VLVGAPVQVSLVFQILCSNVAICPLRNLLLLAKQQQQTEQTSSQGSAAQQSQMKLIVPITAKP
jgi:hypothetical protein